MIHPSKLAIDYVWDYFKKTYFSEKTSELNRQIDRLIQAKNHRPFEERSESHQKFIQNQIQKIRQLEKQFSFLNFEKELNWFSEKLI
jgi:heme oxygenase